MGKGGQTKISFIKGVSMPICIDIKIKGNMDLNKMSPSERGAIIGAATMSEILKEYGDRQMEIARDISKRYSEVIEKVGEMFKPYLSCTREYVDKNQTKTNFFTYVKNKTVDLLDKIDGIISKAEISYSEIRRVTENKIKPALKKGDLEEVCRGLLEVRKDLFYRNHRPKNLKKLKDLPEDDPEKQIFYELTEVAYYLAKNTGRSSPLLLIEEDMAILENREKLDEWYKKYHTSLSF